MRRISLVLGTVLTALVLAAPGLAGGGGCHAEVQSEASTTTVRMQGSCFTPTIARVTPGDTVTFVNDDPAAHTVTGASVLWGSLNHLAKSGTMEAAFDRPGVYPYVCILHPGMIGAVVVGDGTAALAAGPEPAAALVDDDPAATAATDSPAGTDWAPLALGTALGVGLAGAAVTLTRRTTRR
ncbi:MAG: hypothetical protein H0V96_07810 [Acidimicrobiia bacterium]|nr:hypothetical protein [Acidimicrobiia bacterium]